ncbi:hypothetical protein ABTB34_20800, partial [Acinetobacter baumannii]
MAFALPMLEHAIPGLLAQGRVRLLAQWLDRIPAAVYRSRPGLRIFHAWSVGFTRGARQALALTDPLGKIELDAESGMHLLAIRPVLLGMMDRIDE